MGRQSLASVAPLFAAALVVCCLVAQPARADEQPTASGAATATDAPAAPAETQAKPSAVPKSEIEREPIRRASTSSSTANAAPTTQRAGAKTSTPGTGGFDVRRLLISLGVVVALILLMRFGLKRMFGVAAAPRSSRAVQVLTRSPLSPRHQLMVLRVGRRLLVVAEGGGSGQMNTLSEITDPDEVAALLGQLQDDQGERAAKFGSVFGKMRRSYETDVDGGDDEEETGPRPVSESVDPFDPGDGNGSRGDRTAAAAAADPAVTTTRQEVLGLMDKVRMLSRQFKS
jgi:flagellar biogenesis protein FliO